MVSDLLIAADRTHLWKMGDSAVRATALCRRREAPHIFRLLEWCRLNRWE